MQSAYSLHALQDEDITAHRMQCGKVQTIKALSHAKVGKMRT